MFDPFSPEHRQKQFGLWEFMLGILVGVLLVGGVGGFFAVQWAKRHFESMMERERASALEAQAQAQLAQAKAQAALTAVGAAIPAPPTTADVIRAGDHLVDDICEWRWREIYNRGAPEFPRGEGQEEFAARMDQLTLPRTCPAQRPARQHSANLNGDWSATYYAIATPRTGALPIHVQITFVRIENEWLIRELDVTQDK